jgi:hypothetical protein
VVSVLLSYLVVFKICTKSEGLILFCFVLCVCVLTGGGGGGGAFGYSMLLKTVTDYKLHYVKTLSLCQI